MSDHSEGNLPKWARQRLENLRRELHGTRRELAILRGEHEDDADDEFKVCLSRGYKMDSQLITCPLGLYRCSITTPHGYSIEFGERRGSVEARVVEDSGQPGHALNVVPQSSNVVLLRASNLFD